ncbi:MAG TPA: zinc ribbon domain-containing protein [Ktedonobacteraceae bacterium]|nr:zinc ribbon domain-containing protein [Ktedonobacteraceae bacterium]
MGISSTSFPLDVRNFTCPECGVQHDRDINAAKNIVAAGRACLPVGGVGESVRPGAVKTKSGTTPRSRKPSK